MHIQYLYHYLSILAIGAEGAVHRDLRLLHHLMISDMIETNKCDSEYLGRGVCDTSDWVPMRGFRLKWKHMKPSINLKQYKSCMLGKERDWKTLWGGSRCGNISHTYNIWNVHVNIEVVCTLQNRVCVCVCVSSLHASHDSTLCIVPVLADDAWRECNLECWPCCK